MEAKVQLKIVLLGSAGVGKTSLAQQFRDKSFNTTYTPTIGVDFFNTTSQVPTSSGEIPVNHQIWDTAGEERFRKLVTGYVRDSAAIGIVVTPDDLEDLAYYYNDVVQMHANPETPIYVIVNKMDLKDNPQAEEERLRNEIKNISQQSKINIDDEHIIFCSAKDLTATNKVFSTIRNECLQARGFTVVKEPEITPIPLERSSSPTIIEKIKDFYSDHTLWKVGDTALIVGIAATLIALALLPVGGAFILGLPLTVLAVAGIAGAAALLLWNAGCAFGNWWENRSGPPSIDLDNPGNPHFLKEPEEESEETFFDSPMNTELTSSKENIQPTNKSDSTHTIT